jgi:WW domain-binding protein 4
MSQTQRRHEPWRSNERHYCACCNSWMGSDRQSILIHENGKKHRENMEKLLQKRKEEKNQKENDKSMLISSLKKMEEIASLAHVSDVANGSFRVGNSSLDAQFLMGGRNNSNSVGTGNSTSTNTSTGNQIQDAATTKEMKSWQHRKEKRKKSDTNDDNDTNTNADNDEINKERKKARLKKQFELSPEKGHYIIGNTTYLEGSIYYPLFEEDMPIQIWIGSSTMSAEYKKKNEAQDLWKTGIVLRVYNDKGSENDNKNDGNSSGTSTSTVCDISFLRDINDDDESIEKKVSTDRLRLILGSDDLIPKTIEESRLQLMGGEEVINIIDDDDGRVVEVDENTGLSSFRTVSVRKVTVSQTVKEERARVRAKRREEVEKEKLKRKEIEARQMEEAKHANADDSALGAYDVWGKGGYKGININSEVKTDVNDAAKSLSEGKKNIKFKKRSTGKKSMFSKGSKRKQNRRTTFADSDDE